MKRYLKPLLILFMLCSFALGACDDSFDTPSAATSVSFSPIENHEYYTPTELRNYWLSIYTADRRPEDSFNNLSSLKDVSFSASYDIEYGFFLLNAPEGSFRFSGGYLELNDEYTPTENINFGSTVRTFKSDDGENQTVGIEMKRLFSELTLTYSGFPEGMRITAAIRKSASQLDPFDMRTNGHRRVLVPEVTMGASETTAPTVYALPIGGATEIELTLINANGQTATVYVETEPLTLYGQHNVTINYDNMK